MRQARPGTFTLAGLLLAALLAGCASGPRHGSGEYYQNDGPPASIPANLLATPDAVPRAEPYLARANRPYSVMGRTYTPLTGDEPFHERGLASWYGRQYHGRPTASGEPYDMFAMTAAHPTLPIPSYARVTNLRDGRAVVVRINDRGPFLYNRIIDLSFAAASRLGVAAKGEFPLDVERVFPGQERRGAEPAPGAVAMAGAAGPKATAATASDGSVATTSAVPDRSVANWMPLAGAVPALGGVPTATAAAAPSSPSGWAVQFGVFLLEDHAQQLCEQLAARLRALPADAAEAGISPRVEADGGRFRVLMGALQDRTSAARLAQRLAAELSADVSLVLRP